MRRIVTVFVATIGGLVLIASFHTTPGVAPRWAQRAFVADARRRAEAASDEVAVDASVTTSPAVAVDAHTVDTRRRPSTHPDAAPSYDRGPGVADDRRSGRVEPVRRRAGPDRRAGRSTGRCRGARASVRSLAFAGDQQLAGPDLREEALQAQSANIDIISGATYTSQSYASRSRRARPGGSVSVSVNAPFPGDPATRRVEHDVGHCHLPRVLDPVDRPSSTTCSAGSSASTTCSARGATIPRSAGSAAGSSALARASPEVREVLASASSCGTRPTARSTSAGARAAVGRGPASLRSIRRAS